MVSKKRIDRGVGNIAHIVSPEVVRPFIANHRERRSPVDFLGAQTDLNLYVWYNYWSEPPSLEPGSPGMEQQNFEWELSASFWDRLTIGSLHGLGGDLKREASWFLGWKFQQTTPFLTTWTITPGLMRWNYQGLASQTALAVTIDHTYLPLNVRIATSQANGQTNFIWSLGIRFF